MDGTRFDSLTRILTDSRSRRGALASLLGGTLGLVGLTQTEARKKKPCPPCKKRKHGKCKANLPNGSGCPGGTCQNGACVTACTRNCASKTCGTDGCGGSCGSCIAPQTCGGGGTPGQCGGGASATCTTSQDCRDTSNMECRHDLGSICVCREATFDCGTGPCWPCCATADCAARNRTAEAGFVCDTTAHDCVCLDENETACPDGSNERGTIYRCINLNSDADCGFQCNSREACTGGRHCINRSCQ